MRVLDPFFLHIKSWCRKTLRTQGIGGHVWSNMFCTLKSHSNVKAVRCTKNCFRCGNHG